MGPPWAQAFLAAGVITLAGTPLLRRLAVAIDFVDHPEAAHKSHHQATPYLGGIGLMVAVLVGLLFTSRLTPPAAVIALGGAVVGCLGLVDDHRSVGALARFVVEALVATVAVLVGLRIHATDIAVVDGIVTVVWIVGVTNAVNLLDNMDGLAAGVSAAAAGAIFALAVLNEQPAAAAFAAGLAGACLGFVAYNKRPASIFMGDAGSLFLGFVLAVVTIEVSPALEPPASFAVPVMLLALPVLDTVTVVVCRLRRRRSVAQGGKDHLSHRLVACGLSPGGAVGVLVAVEIGVGTLAVLAGRHVVPLAGAVLAVAAMLGGLAVATVRSPVYEEPVVGMAKGLKRGAALAAGALALLLAPGVVALARAYGPGTAGARTASQGFEALRTGDGQAAAALFARAAGDLGRADAALHGPFSSVGLAFPGLRANLATARALTDAGRRVVGAATDVSAVAAAAAVPLPAGADLAAEAAALAPSLTAAADALERSANALAGYNRPYLWPSLGTTVRRVRSEVNGAAARARYASDVARALPALLGGEGPRRYFLAVQDNTELRGSGGVVHRWGEVVTEGGRLRLVHLAPLSELTGAGASAEAPQELLDRYRQFDVAGTWQNTNVSPDFSVTGQVISSLYGRSTDRPVDGVISVDLPGLAALVGAARPVTVEGWPTPIGKETLVDAVVRESFARYPDEARRQAFLTDVVRAAVESFTSAELGTPARLAGALASAVEEGHLRLYATRAGEQSFLGRLGAAGEITEPAGDSLLVVNQNLSATNVDPDLRRRVHYQVSLEPGERSARVTGRLDVTLRNEAPERANRTYVSMYTPLVMTGSTVDGRPGALDADRELGRHVYSTVLDIPPRQATSVEVDLAGTVALTGDGWYRLDVLHQTSLQPDEVTVSLSVPDGWRITEARGLDIAGAGRATATLRLDSPGELSVRLERTPWARLWADP